MLKALPVVGAVLAASVLLIPTTSLASPVEDGAEATATVSYADLDLSRSREIRTLKYRINGVAQGLCGIPLRYEMFEAPERRACVVGAVASAQPAFDAAVRSARRGVVIIGGASLIVTARR